MYPVQHRKEEQRMKTNDIFFESMNEEGTENDEMTLIWGIKSDDDFTNTKCTLATMNDFDIIYLKKRKKYIIGLETIYKFSNESFERTYLVKILAAFTDWMFDNNYSVDKKIDIHHIFTNGVSLNDEFDSIEEAYAAFAFLVHGYCNQ